ncbi:hypothetical protein M2157_004419 [Streptomyces sp. SAI-127]|nr:hypothetical protein [Streptomyces sp. SAI-127]
MDTVAWNRTRDRPAPPGSSCIAGATVPPSVSDPACPAAAVHDVIATACRLHAASRRLRVLPPALTTFGPTRPAQGRK